MQQEINKVNIETLDKTKEKQKGNPDWKKGMESPNPTGRPKGSLGFATLFEEAIKKIATEEDITELEAEKELILTAYREAKKGNFNFYKDIMDRNFGQATRNIDLTSGGKSFVKPTPEELEEANKAIDSL
ncbi:MAG: DUF5681 domain-containing protein [Atribacterota bacterium]|nr:DUF5681 domain-containing protein [Atribacterota bacterium]